MPAAAFQVCERPTLALESIAVAPRRDSRGARFYRPELDTLRLGAFALVYFCHAVPHRADWWAKLVPESLAPVMAQIAAAGRWGVDLFFLLSSYLITALLVREERQCGSVDLNAFYIRRGLRIWPLYFVFATFAFFVLPRFAPTETAQTGHIVGFYAMFGNWTCAWWGYPHSVATPLWSVSVEEQFYILWPLALWAVGVRFIPLLAGALVAAGAISCWWLNGYSVDDPVVWTSTLTHVDAIAIGALLAVVRMPVLGNLSRLLMAGGGGICVALTSVFPQPSVAFPLATVGCALLFCAVLGCEAHFLRWPLLVYLGRISYGLYVFHLLALRVFEPGRYFNWPHSTWMIRPFAALALTIILASASYAWIEKPFLRFKEHFERVKSRPA